MAGVGFTLVELLVVIAIIALLIGILLPVLGAARDTARQARDLSGVRQLMLGYTTYQFDHRGQVLPAFPPMTMAGQPVEVTSASGHTIGALVARRYPWRLVPYVEDVWEILHSHEPTPPAPATGDTDAQAFSKAYALSIGPTFGINAVYVGGHEGFDAFDAQGLPRPARHVVFHEQDVRQTSDLIVLSETRARGPGYSPQSSTGYFYVNPPHARGEHWRADGSSLENRANPTTQNPMPLGRHGPATVTGFFDGHAAALPPQTLDDMRRWSAFAQGPDDDYTP